MIAILIYQLFQLLYSLFGLIFNHSYKQILANLNSVQQLTYI